MILCKVFVCFYRASYDESDGDNESESEWWESERAARVFVSAPQRRQMINEGDRDNPASNNKSRQLAGSCSAGGAYGGGMISLTKGRFFTEVLDGGGGVC